MANTVFSGKVFNTNGIPFTDREATCQGFFYSTNPASPSSKWDRKRRIEDGDYTVDLGSNRWLGRRDADRFNDGDKVFLCIWTPQNIDRNNTTQLLEWCIVEIDLVEGDDLYLNDVQIHTPFNPNPIFDINNLNKVNDNIVITDLNSNDDHSWTYNGLIHRQSFQINGEEMFAVNEIINDSISIDWGDGSPIVTDLDPQGSYITTYPTPGLYDITVTLENQSGLTNTQSFSKSITWGSPICDFNIDNSDPEPVGSTTYGQIVNFTNTTTDPSSRMIVDSWYWDWYIKDSQGLIIGTTDLEEAYGDYDHEYLSVDFDFIWSYAWRNPGDHEVTLRLNWYDGIDWQTIDVTKIISQHKWVINTGLTWVGSVYVDVEETYTPVITGSSGTPPIINYSVDSILTYPNLGPTDVINHTFTTANNHIITQSISYHDGFSDKEKVEDFIIVMNAFAFFTHDTDESKFTNLSVAGTPPLISSLWEVIFEGDVIASLSTEDDFYYNWPYDGTFTVSLTIIDSASSTATYSEVFEDQVVNTGTGETVYSGGGGVIYREVEKPKPGIRVNLANEDDFELDEEEPEISVIIKYNG